MWKEILQIVPSFSPSDLQNVEKKLNQRFANVASKFGKGVMAALLGGGVVGTVLGIANKLLNPLQEVNDTIERALKAADDISTNAKQFNTSAGTLARLNAYAQATGLDQGELYMLIEKFQSQVAQAALNPEQPSAVSNFVGRKDMAEAFFEFVQSVKDIPDQLTRSIVQQQVFGERRILGASSFFNADFKALESDLKSRGLPGADSLTGGIENTAGLANLKHRNDAVRTAKEFDIQGKLITGRTIGDMKKAEDQKAEIANSRIPQFGDLAKLQMKLDRISDKVEKLSDKGLEFFQGPKFDLFLHAVPKLLGTSKEHLEKIHKSRAARGAMKDK